MNSKMRPHVQYRRVQNILTYSRLMSVLIGVGVFGTIGLIAGFVFDNSFLNPEALLKAVLAGAITGLFLFEFNKARSN